MFDVFKQNLDLNSSLDHHVKNQRLNFRSEIELLALCSSVNFGVVERTSISHVQSLHSFINLLPSIKIHYSDTHVGFADLTPPIFGSAASGKICARPWDSVLFTRFLGSAGVSRAPSLELTIFRGLCMKYARSRVIFIIVAGALRRAAFSVLYFYVARVHLLRFGRIDVRGCASRIRVSCAERNCDGCYALLTPMVVGPGGGNAHRRIDVYDDTHAFTRWQRR